MVAVAGVVFLVMQPNPAHAACKTWTATHNGTDLFYPNQGGAAGTAANKLMWQVENFKKEKGLKRVRVGKIKTKCGDWFMKYLLPHKHCVAKARVCY
jgi:hypothetical protein